ncbi:MAG: class I SAM-dependent methyltransferase [Planctomycetota bacterium]
MKIEEFEQRLPTLYEHPFTSDHPIDRRLQPVFESMEGMATENKLALLNLAVSLMDDGEAYFEVGTWKGMSLCGAMFENTQFRCFACDNFAEFGGPKDELFANIAKSGLTDNVEFLEGDFEEVLSRGKIPEKSIGVYFYDGEHLYKTQHRALRTIEPYLADRALVIVDDTGWQKVSDANIAWTGAHGAYRKLFDIDSPEPGEPRWWNGVQVFAFDRSKGSMPGALTRWWRYLRGKLKHERVLGIRWRLRRPKHERRGTTTSGEQPAQ